jgi:hypothetical protein
VVVVFRVRLCLLSPGHRLRWYLCRIIGDVILASNQHGAKFRSSSRRYLISWHLFSVRWRLVQRSYRTCFNANHNASKLLTRSDFSFRCAGPPRSSDKNLRREFLNGGVCIYLTWFMYTGLIVLQFVYYVPNVVIQIVTLVFVTSRIRYFRYATASCADAVASAQSLRITRKLWKSGSSLRNRTISSLPQIENEERSRPHLQVTPSQIEIGDSPRCEPLRTNVLRSLDN